MSTRGVARIVRVFGVLSRRGRRTLPASLSSLAREEMGGGTRWGLAREAVVVLGAPSPVCVPAHSAHWRTGQARESGVVP